jgi:hypothetical protein
MTVTVMVAFTLDGVGHDPSEAEMIDALRVVVDEIGSVWTNNKHDDPPGRWMNVEGVVLGPVRDLLKPA